MKIYITRKAHFAAAHRLYNPTFSEQKNNEIFGLCNNPNFHGHNYNLEVTVIGEPNPETGYVIDLKRLKEIITKNVLNLVDHKNLNLEVEFLKGINPTAENICVAIWNQLKDKISNGSLYSVKLYESERNFVEYKGE